MQGPVCALSSVFWPSMITSYVVESIATRADDALLFYLSPSQRIPLHLTLRATRRSNSLRLRDGSVQGPDSGPVLWKAPPNKCNRIRRVAFQIEVTSCRHGECQNPCRDASSVSFGRGREPRRDGEDPLRRYNPREQFGSYIRGTGWVLLLFPRVTD